MIILKLVLNPVTTVWEKGFFSSWPLIKQVYSRCSFETDFEMSMLQVGFLNISRGFPPNLKISYIHRKTQHFEAKLLSVWVWTIYIIHDFESYSSMWLKTIPDGRWRDTNIGLKTCWWRWKPYQLTSGSFQMCKAMFVWCWYISMVNAVVQVTLWVPEYFQSVFHILCIKLHRNYPVLKHRECQSVKAKILPFIFVFWVFYGVFEWLIYRVKEREKDRSDGKTTKT